MEDQRESHSIISQRDTKGFFHRVIIWKMWNLTQMFTVRKLVNTFNTGLLISNNTAAFESNEDIHKEERINTQAAMSMTKAQSLSDPLMITHRGSPNDN
ncbi:unnamed protein product, partial [Porites evermanni]